MYKIVKKETLNSVVELMEIHAPFVARKCEPGQFIILRVDEDGERVPLTIADYEMCIRDSINASELFVWLGIANGISALNLDTTPLAVRYLLVGLVANFISGWVTEFTTRYVEKQQGVKLSRTLKA